MNTRSLVSFFSLIIVTLASGCAAAPADESSDGDVRVSAPDTSEHPDFYFRRLPNLTIPSIDAYGCAGGTARVTVANTGAAESVPTTVVIHTGSLDTQAAVPALAVGASVVIVMPYRSSTTNIIAEVDPSDLNFESNETDNGYSICVR